MIKTILDYGAKSYESIDEALDKKDATNEAITDMLDDVKVAVLPPYGYMYMDDSVFLYEKFSSVSSLGGSNLGAQLVTDKPISMFVSVASGVEVKGFTARYVGGQINEECAVVRLGGDPRNKGEYKYSNSGERKHNQPNRTKAVGCRFDFDFRGDVDFYESAKTNKAIRNPNFVENGNAHGIWVDYDNDTEHNSSSFHYNKIRGNWRCINTGIKITQRHLSKQAMNSIDIDVDINGFRMLFDIKGTLNRSKIIVEGQHKPMLGFSDSKLDRTSEEWNTPVFYIEGSAIDAGVFSYDRKANQEYGMGRNKIKGQYNTKGLNLVFPLLIEDNKINVDADFNNSTFRQGLVINSISGVKIS